MTTNARRIFEFRKRDRILTSVIASSVDEAWAKVDEQDRQGLFPRDADLAGPLAQYLRDLDAWALLTIVERPLLSEAPVQ